MYNINVYARRVLIMHTVLTSFFVRVNVVYDERIPHARACDEIRLTIFKLYIRSVSNHY